MSHSHSRISIHAIWSTKDRLPTILPTADQLIYNFLEDDYPEIGSPFQPINSKTDHINVLFLLNPQISLADAIKQTIGSSSHPIYQENLIRKKFSWQSDCLSKTVGGILIKKDTLYTNRHLDRNAKKSLQSKYHEILKNNGFEMEI